MWNDFKETDNSCKPHPPNAIQVVEEDVESSLTSFGKGFTVLKNSVANVVRVSCGVHVVCGLAGLVLGTTSGRTTYLASDLNDYVWGPVCESVTASRRCRKHASVARDPDGQDCILVDVGIAGPLFCAVLGFCSGNNPLIFRV